MASTSSYPDPEPQMGGGPGLYVSHNGGTPPSQQQHLSTDPELQLQEHLGGIQRTSDMMHAGGPPGHQMNASLGAHHQFQTPPRPNHSPQQMAQSVMSLEEHNPYSDHDGGSSRKRSKVSRACDECRRKKIRCDATSENGPEACSSCKRTGARCQFSRQPMKRGPSKGYIKELADRLVTLENQIQNPHAANQNYDYLGLNDQSMSEAQAPSQFGRKRTHSMSEGLQDPFGRTSWSGQDRGTYEVFPDFEGRRQLTYQDYPPNGTSQGLNRRGSYGDLTLAGSLIAGSNEEILKAYYNTIHPILPILPQETSSLNRLTNCHALLREAFFLALECGVRSCSPAGLPPSDSPLTQLVHHCTEVLDKAQQTLNEGDGGRQFYNHLVYCQSLVFLILASDKPGTGPMGSTAELLGRLAGRISQIGLNDAKIIREQDQESFDASRRLFWATFIIDRFYASSRNKDTALPLHCGVLSREDFNALGEAGYHLARIADVVGQIAFITRVNSIPHMDPSSPYAFASLSLSSPPTLFLNGQLARLRESLELTDLPSSSLPCLAYQYLRLLVSRLSVHTSSNESFLLTRELLNNLVDGPISPLHHVFANLVASSFIELSERVETQVEAHAAMRELDDEIANGGILQRSPDGSGWDAAIRDRLHQKSALTPSTANAEPSTSATQPNMAGLQHLAAAAVGERESADTTRPTSSSGNGALAANAKHDVTTAAIAAASEAAAAQATAAAAQKQLQKAAGTDAYDTSALTKDGFMSALS